VAEVRTVEDETLGELLEFTFTNGEKLRRSANTKLDVMR
jgi:hypothetical protein